MRGRERERERERKFEIFVSFRFAKRLKFSFEPYALCASSFGRGNSVAVSCTVGALYQEGAALSATDQWLGRLCIHTSATNSADSHCTLFRAVRGL